MPPSIEEQDEPKRMQYVLYATGEDGNGFTQEIGCFDDLDEINIRVGMFAKDVSITIFQEEVGE